MATDLTIATEDRPGALAAIGRALGDRGVNIEGGCGLAVDDRGVVHVLVEDAAAGGAALEEAGFGVIAEQEVVVVPCEDRPGALAAVAGRVAEAGVNLSVFYLATGTRVVLGADDIDALRAAV